MPLTEKSQKLYTPFEYLNYTTKVNNSKESYINALQQLGYENTQKLNARPFNDIINKTKTIITNSYSIKYIGIIEGNMGILSKRVKLEQDNCPPNPRKNEMYRNASNQILRMNPSNERLPSSNLNY